MPSFSPTRSRRNGSARCAVGGGVEILPREFEPVRQFGQTILADPGMGGIGSDHPQSTDGAGLDPVRIWSYARRRGGSAPGDAGEARHLRTVGGIREVASGQQRGGVGVGQEPIALHCPVMLFAPVPGRPMFPVMSARLMIALRGAGGLVAWLTPWSTRS